jgi:hypothetical protein
MKGTLTDRQFPLFSEIFADSICLVGRVDSILARNAAFGTESTATRLKRDPAF